MGKKTCFIGHREIFFKNKNERMSQAIERELSRGCKAFTMGTHGNFDKLALSVCRSLRTEHPDLKIELVITSLHQIEQKEINYGGIWGKEKYTIYDDVDTVMYDIEDVHYKRKITISNRQMIDTCDTMICYVDETKSRSGAKTALRYAQKKRLRIVNLFEKEDLKL